MIHKGRLREALNNPPADARKDINTPLEERVFTNTTWLAARITADEGTWAESEAIALTLGIASQGRHVDAPARGLCIGLLAREIDRVSDTGTGGPALTRLQHIIRAVHDRKPLTVRRYLIEFGKLQTNSNRLDLVLLTSQAAVLLGSDREKAQEIIHQWRNRYQNGRTPTATADTHKE